MQIQLIRLKRQRIPPPKAYGNFLYSQHTVSITEYNSIKNYLENKKAYSAIRLSSSRVIDIAAGTDNTAASLSIIEL